MRVHLFVVYSLREAAKSYSVGPLRGGKGRITKKKKLFLKLEEKNPK